MINIAHNNSPIKTRCAIYTRKSSEEGLDQSFNSLDAQYEACVAYITSQKLEGWKLVKRHYEDGGLSGATLERPGLQALLTDINDGQVDRIVVYKIDRLTRSLADFSKIVERLEKKGASFVSVTQSFNTATSMGRLTLNMLLSFAQFEREVTAERIRDKIAASKAKGLWMGGIAPLGYEPHPDKNIRTLVIHKNQAFTVQRIFQLYDQLNQLSKVETAIQQEQLSFKPRRIHKKIHPGSQKLKYDVSNNKDKADNNMDNGRNNYPSRGAIHKILTNPVYLGKISHKGTLYEGQHEAIITQELWDRVQSQLQQASHKKRGTCSLPSATFKTSTTKDVSSQSPSWLKGKCFDETGDLLTPTYTKKNGRIIRYYISNRLIRGKDPAAWRLPALTFEDTITSILKKQLHQNIQDQKIFTPSTLEEYQSINCKMKTFLNGDTYQVATVFASSIITRVDLSLHQIQITLDGITLATLMEINKARLLQPSMILTSPLQIKKRGIEQKLIIGETIPKADPILIKNLIKAHDWLKQIKNGKNFAQIAKAQNCSEAYIRSHIPLAMLSPKIQKAIIKGTQPVSLTLHQLLKAASPTDWKKQEASIFS